jgi:hypothetical protein
MYSAIDGKLYNLKDERGDDLVSARLLDGAGDVLPVGDDPVLLPEFRIYKSKSFRPLNLPDDVK